MTSKVSALVLAACVIGFAAAGCSVESAEGGAPGAGGSESVDRSPIGKADSLSGSCAEGDVCGGKSKGACWCDDQCATYGDCCSDYAAVCAGDAGGCTTNAECGSGKQCLAGECAVLDGRCLSAADCADSEQCISPACEPGGPCPAGYCVGSAKIRFDANWSEIVTGKLVAGGKVEIEYDPNRLTTCRGTQGGNPAWTIYGYYQMAGSAKQPFWVAGHSSSGQTNTPIIVPPQSGELQIWFENTSIWGCIGYDSDSGQNYRFTVAPLGS